MEIDPLGGRRPKNGRVAVAIHPIDRRVKAVERSRRVHHRAVARHGELRASGLTRRHAFEYRHTWSGHLEAIEIEWRGKERSVMDVDEMSARQVAARVPTALDDLRRALRERLDDDVR